MPFGLGVRDLIGLARETPGPARSIVVSGPRAVELVDALTAEGGDRSLVRVGGDPVAAAAVVVIVDGLLAEADKLRLRTATRAGVPVLAIRLGGFSDPLPYVLPDDVIEIGDAGAALPIAELVTKLVSVLGDDGPALAGRLPVVREPVSRRRTLDAALGGAALVMLARGETGAAGVGRPLLPVLALMQARTLRQLSFARGEPAPTAPAEIATTVGPELGASLGVGLACRTLVRSLPARGRLVEGLVAGAGTFALASAGRYLRLRG